MYGPFVLIEKSGKCDKAERVFLGDLENKDEAWLRDTLFANPEVIPTDEIDSAFGPLIPLCRELRTEAGPIDAVFINPRGRLTIVECKLWRNPEARREVVAQTLHYVSALARWSYADLQRQVSAALGKRGNMPFELVCGREGAPLREPAFVDAVSRSLNEGRFLVLIAGDGIRESLQSLTDLVDRRASKAFSFGLVEVALYRFGKNQFAIQPRVLAKTEIIQRQLTVVTVDGSAHPVLIDEIGDEHEPDPPLRGRGGKKHLRTWWQPLLALKFDDPEQEPPFWLGTNNLVLATPFRGIQIKAYAMVNGSRIGVFVSGTRRDKISLLQKHLKRERAALLAELPDGASVNVGRCLIAIERTDLEDDDAKRVWLAETLNDFANVLRPRLREWYRASRS